MRQWLSVETAPKDGSDFLAFDPSLFGVCIANWDLYRGGWFVDRGGQTGDGYEDMPITHWMPLPPPPETR